MSDPMTQLFTAALGLQAPWRVEQVRFEPQANEIHFDVVCEAQRLACPRCSTPDQPIHDRLQRDWQHLHFFQYRALVHAEVPRVRCSACADRGEPEVAQVTVPWARERSGFTLLFEALVVTLVRMSGMPVRQVGALLGVTSPRLWRSLRVLVEQAYAEVDMRGVDAVGVDEKFVGRLGVITVVHEARSGHVLHVSQGCKAANVGEFAAALREHGGDPAKVGTCTLDMSKAFIAGVATHLPNALACFDPFHLVKLANEAMEKVRRDEIAELPELKGTRFHWLKDASNWSREEIELHWLRMDRNRTARAWRLKEKLREILAWRHAPQVPVLLLMDRWIGWCRRSRLQPFKRLAKTFQAHIDGIQNMLAAANSNARAESINSAIQAAIARARGFRTIENLRTIIYLMRGGLKLPGSPFAAKPAQ
jgi:transposase